MRLGSVERMRPRRPTASRRPATPRVRGSWLLASLLVFVVLSGCVPKDLSNHTEVGGAEEVVTEPPVFPETGRVPDELLVEGLVYDLSTNEVDPGLWTPTGAEARCAAEAIVAVNGEKLSDLGYQPGVEGAGINDIALTSAERDGVVQLFLGCVDAEQMLGSLFLGDDQMRPSEAACMARGLADSALPGAIVTSWVYGVGLDPIGEDGKLAAELMAHANVCLPEDVFLWNGLQLPGADGASGDSVTSETVPTEEG